MRGWSSLRRYFQKLWRAEIEATKDAVEGANDSHLSAARSRSYSDWAAKLRDAARTSDSENRFIKPLSEKESLSVILDRGRNGTPPPDTNFSDLTGRLSPLPSSGDYSGGVPQNQAGHADSTKWILSGEFKKVPDSDNVYAIAYDLRKSSLFVQYKHWAPPMPLGTQAGPGPVYEYKGVSIAEAHSVYRSANVSQWLWDYVRVRGTWGGHKKPYRLVAMSGGYLPRKASMSSDGQEWFIRRYATSAAGSGVVSQLPDRPAPPMGFDGKPLWNYWQPTRGTPNRGRPNNGRPNRGDSPNVPY